MKFSTDNPSLKKRRAKDTRLKRTGQAAIVAAISFLALMILVIAMTGAGALRATYIKVTINLAAAKLDKNKLENGEYRRILKQSLYQQFSDVKQRRDKRKLLGLLNPFADIDLRDQIVLNPTFSDGSYDFWFVASDEVDRFVKGNVDENIAENLRKFSDKEIIWIKQLQKEQRVDLRFNWLFFTNGDSREPELAGIKSAFYGSVLTLIICFLISFPIGVMSSIYLEEFAMKNWLSDVIEVNINNLAAVPSIIFGLLGLAVFQNWFGIDFLKEWLSMPRSSPLLGGVVLSLMTLPIIIIASRAALRSVPPSIREAATGIGASPVQVTFHHVVPLAMPGMLTGTIIGMARALGETAPLLMIGMVAFIADAPTSFVKASAALPVQIFLWADSSERAFIEKASAVIIVLLFFLIAMNMTAIFLRKRYELRF